MLITILKSIGLLSILKSPLLALQINSLIKNELSIKKIFFPKGIAYK